MKKAEELGDELCKWCPLDKKGVYHVPGGFMAGCEGSRCKEAYESYESYLEECASDTMVETGSSHNIDYSKLAKWVHDCAAFGGSVEQVEDYLRKNLA